MKPKKNDAAPLEQHWICEGCQDVTQGADPPDFCRLCQHPMFENAADLFNELEADGKHWVLRH